jgi:murein L,D-transpeptidase YcbB/YkuD
MKRSLLSPEREVEWNARARLFVETFQKIMGTPPDSLAGMRTFKALRDLDVTKRVSAEEWQAIQAELWPGHQKERS